MASELTIFSIYKTQNEDKYFLLRTERPSFSNASQIQEDLADKIEQNKREYILGQIRKNHTQSGITNFDFIGEFQDYPIGDKLYLDNGNLELDIYYLETKMAQARRKKGNANSDKEFLAELNEDEDLLRLKPVGEPKQIIATFLTENDFDLSEVENYLTKDVRLN